MSREQRVHSDVFRFWLKATKTLIGWTSRNAFIILWLYCDALLIPECETRHPTFIVRSSSVQNMTNSALVYISVLSWRWTSIDCNQLPLSAGFGQEGTSWPRVRKELISCKSYVVGDEQMPEFETRHYKYFVKSFALWNVRFSLLLLSPGFGFCRR